MWYIIYRTTNVVNNHYYIGRHETKILEDGYLGSGVLLKEALEFFGKDNFHREIIAFCEDHKSLVELEKNLVTWDVVLDPMSYNNSLGGRGGKLVLDPLHPKYRETIDKIQRANLSNRNFFSQKAKEQHKLKRIGMWGKKHSLKAKESIGKKHKGKIVSAQTRKLLSQKSSENNKGGKNPRARKCSIKGTSYNCMEEASLVLGLPIHKVTYRLKTSKFTDWFFI